MTKTPAAHFGTCHHFSKWCPSNPRPCVAFAGSAFAFYSTSAIAAEVADRPTTFPSVNAAVASPDRAAPVLLGSYANNIAELFGDRRHDDR